MASPTVKDPKYINWIRSGLGLLIVKRSISPATMRIIEDFYKAIGGVPTPLPGAIPGAAAAVPAPGCSCTFNDIDFKKKGMKTGCTICNPFVQAILAAHKFPIIQKDNCDPCKWSTDPWEIAKAFMGPGQQKDNHDADGTDCSNLILMWENCSHFSTHISDPTLLKKVREARNAGMHSPKMTLSDAEMKSAFTAMIKLLQDATLSVEPDIDVSSGVSELEKLRDQGMSIMPEDELKVWLDDIKSLGKSLDELKTENEPVAAFLKKNPGLLEKINQEWPKLQGRVTTVEQGLHHVKQDLHHAEQGLRDVEQTVDVLQEGVAGIQLKIKKTKDQEGTPRDMHIKLVLVGDGGAGKSCLLLSYATNIFNDQYVPTLFDNYSVNAMYHGKPINLGLWDTAGQEDYDRLRPLSYPQTNVFLVCFSLNNRTTLENSVHKWDAEISHFCPRTPTILVGCKSDLRGAPGEDAHRVISYDEGMKVARSLGYQYMETSALTRQGVEACFEMALKSVFDQPRRPKKSRALFGHFKKAPPVAPVMPSAGKAPWVEVETSTFANDWRKMSEDPRHSDVIFNVEAKHRLKAHKVLLCSASEVFAKVLGVVDHSKNQFKKVNPDSYFTREQLNSGCVPGIAEVHDERAEEDKTRLHTVVELQSDIKGNTFAHVLQFLYTGVPDLGAEVGQEDLDNLIKVSRIFKLAQLETICNNVKTEQDFLNPSIGTYLNDETAKRMKEMFLNQTRLADVVFDVEGEKVYAHKAVIGTRCEVMAAMFSHHFAKGSADVVEVPVLDCSKENLLALLEYTYTDHAPIEDGDSMGIIVLADLYCQPRLINLCELYVTKEVERSVTKNIEKSDVDVIGVLHMAQLHNAEQLSKWCLHFIASNYLAFERREEFRLLKGENLQVVDENRWPPVGYLKEAKEYEKQMAKYDEKCSIM